MRNVTVTLEDDAALWARVEAARRDTSLSRFLGELLRERMMGDREYAEARERFFSVQPRPLRETAAPYPRREELHERSRLRR